MPFTDIDPDWRQKYSSLEEFYEHEYDAKYFDRDIVHGSNPGFSYHNSLQESYSKDGFDRKR